MTVIRVFRYGLLRPIENSDEVRRQMRLAHEYRNKLVEIERARRAELRQAISSHGTINALEVAVAKADATVVEIMRQQKAARAKSRSFRHDAETKEQLSAAKKAKRDALVALRAARRELRENGQAQAVKDAIDEKYAALRRQARAACGVYWGSYLLIEAADQAARKAPLYDDAEPNDPKFVRWNGDGMIGIQVQGGRPVDEATTLIRIEPGEAPPGVDPQSKRSARRRYATLAFRIGSTDKGAPIWARFPMVMHRPIPDGAIVKMATVSLTNVGPREQWVVNITVEMDPAGFARDETRPRVAVDLGWRLVEGGMRVAAWRSDRGDHGILEVRDGAVMARLRKVEDLRSIRDKNFDAAREALAQWLAANDGILPDWLRERTKTLAQWKSQGRLAAVVKHWRGARFDGDESGYGATEAWRYQDFHLWEWETSLRLKVLRHRREIYRTFAASLAAQYGKVVLEKFDLRDFAKKNRDKHENEEARYSRVVVAPSELRGCLVQAFRGAVEYVPAEYTTKTCAECGSVQEWDQAEEVEHTCTVCGSHWDQDDNAARNLLAYKPCDDVGGESAEHTDAADDVDAESRWAKARRMAAEKKQRRELARTGT